MAGHKSQQATVMKFTNWIKLWLLGSAVTFLTCSDLCGLRRLWPFVTSSDQLRWLTKCNHFYQCHKCWNIQYYTNNVLVYSFLFVSVKNLKWLWFDCLEVFRWWNCTLVSHTSQSIDYRLSVINQSIHQLITDADNSTTVSVEYLCRHFFLFSCLGFDEDFWLLLLPVLLLPLDFPGKVQFHEQMQIEIY